MTDNGDRIIAGQKGTELNSRVSTKAIYDKADVKLEPSTRQSPRCLSAEFQIARIKVSD
jgi:hypothetical protein